MELKEGLAVFKMFLTWKGKVNSTLTKFSKDTKLGSVISTNDARENMQSTWRS